MKPLLVVEIEVFVQIQRRQSFIALRADDQRFVE